MNLFDIGVGVAIGLALAAGDWTFAKIGARISAWAKVLVLSNQRLSSRQERLEWAESTHPL